MKTKYKNNDHLPRYYNGDTRYERVKEQMDLLGITDVTTNRQNCNGTIVWRLPIRVHTAPSITKFIEVASFSTGYVRNQNSGYSNYQLNKRCQGEPEYFELPNGDYRRFSTRSCVLIPIEIDRLEYLISYCLKNYYIKRANEVADGKFISKWEHEWKLNQANETYSENTGAMARINDLEEKLDAMTEARDYYLNKVHSLENKLSNAISPTKYEVEKTYSVNLEEKVMILQTKLKKIKRISE